MCLLSWFHRISAEKIEGSWEHEQFILNMQPHSRYGSLEPHGLVQMDVAQSTRWLNGFTSAEFGLLGKCGFLFGPQEVGDNQSHWCWSEQHQCNRIWLCYKHIYSKSSLDCCSTGETSFTGWFFAFNAQKCLNEKPTAVNEQLTAAEYQSRIMKAGIA